MSPLEVAVILAVLIGVWYSLASVIGRRINARAALACAGLCDVRRYLAPALHIWWSLNATGPDT